MRVFFVIVGKSTSNKIILDTSLGEKIHGKTYNVDSWIQYGKKCEEQAEGNDEIQSVVQNACKWNYSTVLAALKFQRQNKKKKKR